MENTPPPSAYRVKVRESCFVIQKFDVTHSGNYPGWTSFSDYKMTTKFISQPLPVFKMNCITHILLLWAWRHTCTLSGLPLSRQYEIPWLFQTKIRLYHESETKIFKIRIFNLAENEFQTIKSPGGLFPDFWNFVTNSLTFQGFPGQSQPCTVELTANVRKPCMNYVNGLKQIFDYWSCYLLWIFKYLTLKIYYWQHPKICFRWQKWFLQLYICFILPLIIK